MFMNPSVYLETMFYKKTCIFRNHVSEPPVRLLPIFISELPCISRNNVYLPVCMSRSHVLLKKTVYL